MNRPQFQLKEVLKASVPDPVKTILYLSHSDGKKRATVVHTSPQPFEEAWQALVSYVDGLTLSEQKYMRVDLVTHIAAKSYAEALREIGEAPRSNYFRKGIAFDPDFQVAFLAEEIQGNALVKVPTKGKSLYQGAGMTFDPSNLSRYLTRMTGETVDFDPQRFQKLYFFETSGFLLELAGWRPLAIDDVHSGVRRYTSQQLGTVLPSVITVGRSFLAKQMTSAGFFVYGYYPTYDAIISGYNTIRHLSSLYAWLEVEAFSPTIDGLDRIKHGLDWALQNLTRTVSDQLFLIEYLGDRNWPRVSLTPPDSYQIKLGAQAMALLALSKYMAVTGSKEYLQPVQMIANGIQEQFMDQQGNTIHILKEDLSVKKEFEIVYYDGEAVFGLLRAYAVTQDQQLFQLAKRLFDRLIEKEYQRYHDHWLSYAANEILQYSDDEAYYNFGVRNALDNLSFIEKRDTAYPTMLELLMAAVKLTDKLASQPFAEKLLTPQEIQRLQTVATKRALQEINVGVMYPEIGMYFKVPDKIIGGFMTRHDRFRMRIDDQEHYLSGLVNYYEYMYGRSESQE